MTTPRPTDRTSSTSSSSNSSNSSSTPPTVTPLDQAQAELAASIRRANANGAADQDHPHVRAARKCPLCNNAKDAGLLVCWTCYHAHDLRNGLKPYASISIDEAEAEAAARAERRAAKDAADLRATLRADQAAAVSAYHCPDCGAPGTELLIDQGADITCDRCGWTTDRPQHYATDPSLPDFTEAEYQHLRLTGEAGPRWPYAFDIDATQAAIVTVRGVAADLKMLTAGWTILITIAHRFETQIGEYVTGRRD